MCVSTHASFIWIPLPFCSGVFLCVDVLYRSTVPHEQCGVSIYSWPAINHRDKHWIPVLRKGLVSAETSLRSPPNTDRCLQFNLPASLEETDTGNVITMSFHSGTRKCLQEWRWDVHTVFVCSLLIEVYRETFFSLTLAKKTAKCGKYLLFLSVFEHQMTRNTWTVGQNYSNVFDFTSNIKTPLCYFYLLEQCFSMWGPLEGASESWRENEGEKQKLKNRNLYFYFLS